MSTLINSNIGPIIITTILVVSELVVLSYRYVYVMQVPILLFMYVCIMSAIKCIFIRTCMTNHGCTVLSASM